MKESEYIRDGQAIYAQSFAIIAGEADLSAVSADMRSIVIRMIHACGQTDLVDDIAFAPELGSTARAALQAGAPILADSEMVVRGITRKRLPADNDVICTLRDEATPALAERIGNTRSAAAIELWTPYLDGAVVAIGNAPTALFHLLDRIAAGGPKPAAIIGVPVGFVGAVESKAALAAHASAIPYLTVHGRRGGSAITAAAINALASEAV